MSLQAVGVAGTLCSGAMLGYSQMQALNEPVESRLSSLMDHSTDSDPEDLQDVARHFKLSYWTLFYWTDHIGCILGICTVSYLCQDIGFYIGWSVPTALMLFALCFLCWRYDDCFESETNDFALQSIASITWFGVLNQSKKEEAVTFQQHGSSPNNKNERIEAVTFQQRGSSQNNKNEPIEIDRKYRRLDVSRSSFGGPFADQLVDEVQHIYDSLRILPFIWVFWTAYCSIGSLFYSQGCQMDYYVDSWPFPIGAMVSFEMFAIIVCLPFVDRVLYPAFFRWGYPLDFLSRIQIGFIWISLAMIVAGIVEIYRKDTGTMDVASACNSNLYISNISIFWQFPQYALCGVGEVFLGPTVLTFLSNEASPSMKAIFVSLYYSSMGIGSVFAAMLVAIVDLWTPEWIPNDLDKGHLEYYFFLTASLMLITSLILKLVAIDQTKFKPLDEWASDSEEKSSLRVDDSSEYTSLDDNEQYLY